MLPNDFVILYQHLLKVTSAKKNVTSENLVSDVHLKNFLISWKCYAPFSRYIIFCISDHFINRKVCDIMTSISTQEKREGTFCSISFAS